ncbi:hypothetical protein, partial [Staphylococcus epidermidis]|uniref:hypothetical protein n=1 Tax=Staphylococcus epidermidis TaxID=1282 RepID=UPI001643236E
KEELSGDSSELERGVEELKRRGDRNNKKGRSMNGYNKGIESLEREISCGKDNGNGVIEKPTGSVEEVNNGLEQVNQLNQ